MNNHPITENRRIQSRWTANTEPCLAPNWIFVEATSLFLSNFAAFISDSIRTQ